MRTIYIAGPMRGYPEHNFPAFNRAAERFRALGWDVRNPVDIGAAIHGNGNPNIPGGEYLRADVREICDCSAIALLAGWEASTGARAEVALGISIGLDFYSAGTCIRREPPAYVTVCGGYERAPGAVETVEALITEIREWQRATFPHATPSSIAEHMRREVIELCARPDDLEEMADVFFLLAGATSQYPQFFDVVRAKLEKNRRRVWGKPDAHGVVEHVAEGAV